LVGVQPLLTQVPPNGPFSTTANPTLLTNRTHTVSAATGDVTSTLADATLVSFHVSNGIIGGAKRNPPPVDRFLTPTSFLTATEARLSLAWHDDSDDAVSSRIEGATASATSPVGITGHVFETAACNAQ
jgi:hypothetical protein